MRHRITQNQARATAKRLREVEACLRALKRNGLVEHGWTSGEFIGAIEAPGPVIICAVRTARKLGHPVFVDTLENRVRFFAVGKVEV